MKNSNIPLLMSYLPAIFTVYTVQEKMEIIDNQYLKKWLCIPNYKRRMKKLFEGISLTGYSISLTVITFLQLCFLIWIFNYIYRSSDKPVRSQPCYWREGPPRLWQSSICWGQSTFLTVPFLSLPASHLCHQGLGWPSVIVRSIAYQQLILIPQLQI